MTDRYKDEFIANSDWFHLAFHARSEFPDNPYVQAETKQFKKEYADIIREIRRFAGEEVIEKATTNHWGSSSADIVRAEKALGIDALMGYMELGKEGKKKYPKKGSIEVMIHGQYFYPTYMNHLPDFKERVLSTCKWCVEHGYKGAFAEEAVTY